MNKYTETLSNNIKGQELYSNRTCGWIAFLAFGIDILASFPDGPVALIKSIVLGLIIIFGCHTISITKDSVSSSGIFKAVFFYLFILTIRLVYDFIYLEIPFFLFHNISSLFIIFLGTIIIPAIVFGTHKFTINFDMIVMFLRILFLAVLFLSVKDILTGKMIMLGDGRYEGNGVLDAIYLGHQGTTLILLSIYRFRSCLWLNIPCIIIGILAVGCAGSRGPMLALIVCLSIHFLFNVKSSRIRFLIISIFIAVGIFFKDIVNLCASYFNNIGITSFTRIAAFLNGKDTIGARENIFETGAEYFLDNPILGKNYLLPDYSYVHNIFIEQFMALGLFGGMLFLYIMSYTLVTGFKNWVNKGPKSARIFFIIFIQYLIFGCFSRTIVALPQLWICTFIILHYDRFKYIGKVIGQN